MLQPREIPLLFHVGGGGRLVEPTFAANGLEPEKLYHKRETTLPSLTYIGIPAPVEMALAALILDGVFERFPRLRCGVIEQGATWVPGFMKRLDSALEQFGRPRQRASLSLSPSEYFLRQVRVTPFPFEDIAWLVKETGPAIYLFGTDYPHDEGGGAPLESFDRALEAFPIEVQDAVYWRNFQYLMGSAIPDWLSVRRVEDHSSDSLVDEIGALRRTGEPLSVHRKKVLLRLLVYDIAARLKIVASAIEVQDAIDTFRTECGLFDLQETLEWMHSEGVTEESLGRVMRDGVLTDKIYCYLYKQLEHDLIDHIRVATGRRWQLRKSAKTVKNNDD
jgi:hypothetical protein